MSQHKTHNLSRFQKPVCKSIPIHITFTSCKTGVCNAVIKGHKTITAAKAIQSPLFSIYHHPVLFKHTVTSYASLLLMLLLQKTKSTLTTGHYIQT